ncbi:MAG: UDP-3-O-(3-hydroxymyristoyl)glucosamine N-acyltransferase [Fidelibacterota bacterium]
MATLKELAALVHGDIDGDPQEEITGVAEIQDAPPGSISFLHNPKYRKFLKTTRASAVVISRDEEVGDLNAIRVDNPALSFSKILDHFAPGWPVMRGIHSTAVVSDAAEIGENVSVGAYAVVEEEVVLGDGVSIGPHSFVGYGSRIGSSTQLKFHVSVYQGCVLGNHVLVHSGTVIGSDGFGFVTEGGIHHKMSQVGGVVIDDHVEIGANCAIDRGTVGDTHIGAGSKLDNLVHIAHNVKLGMGCLVTAQVGISGSTVVGDYVAFGGQSGAVGHIEVGSHARLAAKTGITKSLGGHKTYAGMPAREIGEKNRLDALVRRLPQLVKKINELDSEISNLKGNQ